ncbi:porin OmpL1 [Leptospira sp. 201903071]|uniref:porin OmpL1 n=1 Tax=Leptospira ainazelensis TaxID=2810034 RepID=UPI0019628908|nr:porin OmpL1 [Leptospira ainazelensis]MBM9502636.1 porin OmpL1 [Leptospira ainazelensis]
MVRNMSKVLLVLALFSSAASLSAKSYGIVGFGLQLDLGQLGGTITKDGLDAATYYGPVRSSNVCTVGTDAGCIQDPSKATGSGTYIGVAPRRAIPAENRLITLERTSGGIINAGTTKGAMVGGNLMVGYESDFAKYFFWRVAAEYTQKISGGVTKADIAGYSIVDITWGFSAIVIPATVGIKLNVTEDTAVYMGAGLNYFNGGWSLNGTNNIKGGYDILTAAGVTSLANLLSDGTDPVTTREHTRFRASGIAPNFLIGTQARVTDKGHVFIELETIMSAAYSVGKTQSVGGASNLSPYPAYPIVVGGQIYRFGYKHEL